MAKLCLILVVITMCYVSTSLGLPRQYRYYPPTPSRFAGWTVTSQELLALPSANEPANIVRVAPPPEFLKSHRISRRSSRVYSPDSTYIIPNVADMLKYS